MYFYFNSVHFYLGVYNSFLVYSGNVSSSETMNDIQHIQKSLPIQLEFSLFIQSHYAK